jgi:hypothetical protein
MLPVPVTDFGGARYADFGAALSSATLAAIYALMAQTAVFQPASLPLENQVITIQHNSTGNKKR